MGLLQIEDPFTNEPLGISDDSDDPALTDRTEPRGPNDSDTEGIYKSGEPYFSKDILPSFPDK